ncbi:hypothetical protein Tco_0323702, partial [Tanacetum coccineum]
ADPAFAIGFHSSLLYCLAIHVTFQTLVITEKGAKNGMKREPKNKTAWICRIRNWSNAFSCKLLALIRRISFAGYGVLVKIQQSSNIFILGDDGDVMFIEIVKKNDDSRKEEPIAGGLEVEYFDIFPTQSELAYHKYLMCDPIPLIFLRNPIITEGCPSNLKIPCNIRHVHVEKAYIDLNSPLNIMTRMMYNWFMRRKLDPKENSDRGVSDFTRRIKGMHVFVRNFTFVMDFMIFEDISSIIDPRLSQVVLGKPFIEISNMTHDPPEEVVRFINGTNEIAYKIPHKIEQYNSLSDLEKEHTKSVYLSNEEDKRRGVEYVMSKILRFYKECLELGPEYVTGMDDEGEVT